MNLPPRDIMEKIYFIAPTDINDDEAFGIFQNFFAGPKPLIGVFSLKDLKTSSALLECFAGQAEHHEPFDLPLRP